MNISAIVEHFHILVEVAQVNPTTFKVNGQFKKWKIPTNSTCAENHSRSLLANQERGHYIHCFPILKRILLCTLLRGYLTYRAGKFQDQVNTVTPARKMSEGNYANDAPEVALMDQALSALYLIEKPVIENHSRYGSSILSL